MISVYFAKVLDGYAIKIGFTKNLNQRLKELKLAYVEDAQFVYICEGGRDREWSFHQQFKHLLIINEVFEYRDELKEFLDSKQKPGYYFDSAGREVLDIRTQQFKALLLEAATE